MLLRLHNAGRTVLDIDWANHPTCAAPPATPTLPVNRCPPPAGGPPPLPPHEAPPLPEEEPDAKRARLDTFVLTPEEEFADAHPGQAKASWGAGVQGHGVSGQLAGAVRCM